MNWLLDHCVKYLYHVGLSKPEEGRFSDLNGLDDPGISEIGPANLAKLVKLKMPSAKLGDF